MPKRSDLFPVSLTLASADDSPEGRLPSLPPTGEPASRLPPRLEELAGSGERVPAGSGERVIDLQAARQRLRAPQVDGRQALVLTLVEQLAGLVRGTTNPERAGAVRRAASRALDVLDRLDAGEANADEAQKAFREVEALLARQR